jgi:hypothetical protein
MELLKLNVGTTSHSLQDKLHDVQDKGEATKQDVTDGVIVRFGE